MLGVKIIIEIEVVGADPAAIIEATRVSLGCDELQAGIVSVAEHAGHGNVRVLSAEVVASEQMIGGLRDQFALAAMQGLLAADDGGLKQHVCATLAYDQADEMLRARGSK